MHRERDPAVRPHRGHVPAGTVEHLVVQGVIRPVRSAAATNTSGGTGPRSRSVHRASASTATVLRSLSRTIGW